MDEPFIVRPTVSASLITSETVPSRYGIPICPISAMKDILSMPTILNVLDKYYTQIMVNILPLTWGAL
jgi:hypothetical protein